MMMKTVDYKLTKELVNWGSVPNYLILIVLCNSHVNL
jgi:hypothetical protein